MQNRKVHFLRPGLYGLFKNFLTYCNVPVVYVRDCWMRSVYTRARYDYTNDWSKVTCKSCLKSKERQDAST